MEIIDVKDRIGFTEKFVPRILKVSPEYKVPLICLDAGQVIAPHVSGTGVFYIIEGAGVMTVGGEESEIKAGNMVFVGKGELRGIRATEKLVAFAVHLG